VTHDPLLTYVMHRAGAGDVGWARELLGGNGILLDHHVARFVADAETIYSYECTREINALVVGRAITGFGAFV
jgi:glutaryl-CoA dehydrogenase